MVTRSPAPGRELLCCTSNVTLKLKKDSGQCSRRWCVRCAVSGLVQQRQQHTLKSYRHGPSSPRSSTRKRRRGDATSTTSTCRLLSPHCADLFEALNSRACRWCAQGRLFLEDMMPKNVATSLKSPKFLRFFFRQLRINDTGVHVDYGYVSPCGSEMNFVKPADTVRLRVDADVMIAPAAHVALLSRMSSLSRSSSSLSLPMARVCCLLEARSRCGRPPCCDARCPCGGSCILSSLPVAVSVRRGRGDGVHHRTVVPSSGGAAVQRPRTAVLRACPAAQPGNGTVSADRAHAAAVEQRALCPSRPQVTVGIAPPSHCQNSE